MLGMIQSGILRFATRRCQHGEAPHAARGEGRQHRTEAEPGSGSLGQAASISSLSLYRSHPGQHRISGKWQQGRLDHGSRSHWQPTACGGSSQLTARVDFGRPTTCGIRLAGSLLRCEIRQGSTGKPGEPGSCGSQSRLAGSNGRLTAPPTDPGRCLSSAHRAGRKARDNRLTPDGSTTQSSLLGSTLRMNILL